MAEYEGPWGLDGEGAPYGPQEGRDEEDPGWMGEVAEAERRHEAAVRCWRSGIKALDAARGAQYTSHPGAALEDALRLTLVGLIYSVGEEP